jgi:hypothetical protein
MDSTNVFSTLQLGLTKLEEQIILRSEKCGTLQNKMNTSKIGKLFLKEQKDTAFRNCHSFT